MILFKIKNVAIKILSSFKISFVLFKVVGGARVTCFV